MPTQQWSRIRTKQKLEEEENKIKTDKRRQAVIFDF